MKKIIYKELLNGSETRLSLSKGAEVVAFKLMKGQPHLIVVAAMPEVYKETRVFTTYLTGRSVSGKYVGTIETENGTELHCFEQPIDYSIKQKET